jgi:hypothetical protein
MIKSMAGSLVPYAISLAAGMMLVACNLDRHRSPLREERDRVLRICGHMAFMSSFDFASSGFATDHKHQGWAKGLFLAGGLYGTIVAVKSLFTNCLRSRRQKRLMKEMMQD